MRRKNRGNGSILRQILALAICLSLTLCIPAVQRTEAADPITTARHYAWKQIRTQADIPEKGTYPMLLCYTDLNGNHWFLTGNSLQDDKYLFRDGVSKKQSGWPTEVQNRYRAWREENALPDTADSKGRYLKAYPDEERLTVQYQDEPLESDYDTNYMKATDASQYPEIALYSDSFYTDTLPGDWEMTVTGKTVNGLKTIQISSGGLSLYDGYKVTWNFMAAIEWDSEDASDYSVYTTDVESGRKDWTLQGCVQLFHAEGKLEYDTGLCWDYERFGGIEDNNDHFSSFKLYYAETREFSVIDSDYVVTDGSILNTDNDLELRPGTNLIIAPGGILSVNGVFFNNGVIHNCGTMILNPGAVVTTLEPDRTDCGQLNCYGASTIRFAAERTEAAPPGEKQYYSMSMSELEREIGYLEENLDWGARQTDDVSNLIEYWTERKAELEAIYEYRKYPKEAMRQLLKSMKGTAYSYSRCSGELIVLEDAALLFADQPDSRLNLYEGSTCSNSGVIAAPYGVKAEGGELINRENAHLFIGYAFEQALGSGEQPRVVNPGTASAKIGGMKTKVSTRALFDLSGKYHVRNDGTLLLNGLLCRTATELEPGSRFYDRNRSENQKYYHW